MAGKTVYTSDLSGERIESSDLVVVTLMFSDENREPIVLDVSAREIEELARRGRRKPVEPHPDKARRPRAV